jgi:nicotinamide mononucleotide transporter
MTDRFLAWTAENWVEIVGAVLGIAYIFFSIKQHRVTWILGFLTSVFYIYVFFVSKFYADMALQGYYVFISIYGWLLWVRGDRKNGTIVAVKVSNWSIGLIWKLLLVSALLFGALWFLLKFATDSPVPVGDAFTTALSIVATWMLAKKIIEHWLIWVVVDAVSLALYLYKGLYATSILFAVYTLAAIWGYYEWKKDLNEDEYRPATH